MKQQRRRILFLAHRIPYPPDKGDKIRSYHTLRFLARRNDVYLACLCDSAKDWQRLPELRPLVKEIVCERIFPIIQKSKLIKAIYSELPLTVHYFYHEEFRRKLKRLLSQIRFDVIYVYSSNVAGYVADVEAPCKIVDFCDLDSFKFQQFATEKSHPGSFIFKMEAKRLAEYEKKIASKFNYVIFINEKERKLFEGNGPARKLIIMRNGANLQIRNTENGLSAEWIKMNAVGKYLVFVGAMDYLPNAKAVIWFVENVYYKIKSVLPDFKFYVIGRHPLKEVRQLHKPEDGIFITGYLDQIEPIISNAFAFVAPIHIARGMQTKLLEAMSFGVPVITSEEAARGIGAMHEREIIIANHPEEYVQYILKLAFNDLYRKQIVRSAFRFLRHNFNWDQNLRVLETLIESSPGRAKSRIALPAATVSPV